MLRFVVPFILRVAEGFSNLDDPEKSAKAQEAKVHREARKSSGQKMTTEERQVFKTNVLGPEFPPISRIRNLYHKNILLYYAL